MPIPSTNLQDELAALFVAASSDASRRVREVGLPTVIPEQRIIIMRDKTDPNVLSGDPTTYMRKNALSNETAPLYRLAPLLSPNTVSSINRCATQLIELENSNLPFFSPFEGPSWMLAYGLEIIGTGGPSDYVVDAVDWTSRHLLLPALLDRIRKLPNLSSVSNEAARSFAAEVMRVATAPNLEYMLSIPLAGIMTRTRVASVQGDATLRPLTAREQGDFLSAWGILTGNLAPVPAVVLELIIPTARNAQNPDVQEVLSKWLCAQFLNGYDPAGYKAQLQSHPSWALSSSMNIPIVLPPRAVAWSSMTPMKFEKVCETVRQLARYSISNPASVHELALSRFYTGVTRSSRADGILDFAIALEALLLPYDEDARRGDLSYRFRIHGGYFLSGIKNERGKVARQLTELYNLRSRLVHGAHYPAPADIDSGWATARHFAQRGLCRAIADRFPTAETFKKMILEI
jgi:hypothetical protein